MTPYSLQDEMHRMYEEAKQSSLFEPEKCVFRLPKVAYHDLMTKMKVKFGIVEKIKFYLINVVEDCYLPESEIVLSTCEEYHLHILSHRANYHTENLMLLNLRQQMKSAKNGNDRVQMVSNSFEIFSKAIDNTWSLFSDEFKLSLLSTWSDFELLEAKDRCINDERFEDVKLIDEIIQSRLFR